MGMLRGVQNLFDGRADASTPIMTAWCVGPGVVRLVVGRGAELARIGPIALAIAVMSSVVLGGRPAMAGIVDNTDPELELALSCGAAKKASSPCEVKACFQNYLRNTAPANLSPDAQNMLNSADQACRLATPQSAASDDEERLWEDARRCLVQANPCVAKSCYSPYMEKYGANGKLLLLVQRDLDRAQKACPPPTPLIPDGVYNGHATEVCGAKKQFGVIITVKNGAISWEHDFRGATYKWAGVVGPNGGIHASVVGKQDIVADGEYNDNTHDILMHYPDCGGNSIPLTVLSRIR
jgi:hypothetical protein